MPFAIAEIVEAVMLSAKKSSNVIVHFDSLLCHSNGGHFFISQIVVPLLPVLLEFISKWFSSRLSEKNVGAGCPPSFNFWLPEQVF